MSREEYDEESLVGFVQLYCERSVTSLKRTGVSAYLFHISMMNLSYERWNKKLLAKER